MVRFSIAHKTTSILLSILVLFSTLSLTVEKHFCGNTLVDIAIFSESKKCGMEMTEMKSESQTVKKSCCKDEIDVIEGQDDVVVKTLDDLEDSQKQVLFAYTYTYLKLFEELPNLEVPHEDYIPPKLIKDIHVLDQVYLI